MFPIEVHAVLYDVPLFIRQNELHFVAKIAKKSCSLHCSRIVHANLSASNPDVVRLITAGQNTSSRINRNTYAVVLRYKVQEASRGGQVHKV